MDEKLHTFTLRLFPSGIGSMLLLLVNTAFPRSTNSLHSPALLMRHDMIIATATLHSFIILPDHRV